jgi:hypothetical protein
MYRNTLALRSQVTVTGCRSTPVGWEATGAIKNSGPAAHDYRLTVYFTDAAATVLASGKTSSTVGAGKRGTWRVASTFFSPTPVNCALVGVA